MAEALTPGQNNLGQCVWAVVGAAMDGDHDAIRYLVSGLDRHGLTVLVSTLARMAGTVLTTAYGPEEGRRVVAAKAVEYAQAAGE